jgi:predicted nucleic acid-binding protein
LPDVNVWLALADENHLHHPRALSYWHEESVPAMVFCRVTMLGFLRLGTHPKVLSRPHAPFAGLAFAKAESRKQKLGNREMTKPRAANWAVAISAFSFQFSALTG